MAAMHRDEALIHLRRLLEACRVRVDGVTHGAGFFVAPNWVVACAHVSGSEVGGQVAVSWDDEPFAGVIRTASMAPRTVRGMWPFPDLALVEVVGAPEAHPCVLLSGTQSPDGTPLAAAGFSSVYMPGDLAEQTVAFSMGGETRIDGGPAVLLHGHEVSPGLSGGAVLSSYSGTVCAIVKASRAPGSPLGGIGVPVDGLRSLDSAVYRAMIRAHDRFHDRDRRWASLSDQVSAPRGGSAAARWLTPSDRCKFLALLAELPDSPESADLAAAFEAAAPDAIVPRIPLRDYRDVFTELAAIVPPESGSVPYELRFAADLATQPANTRASEEARQRLRDQLLIAAGQISMGTEVLARLADTGERPHRVAIIARLRHSGRERKLYRVMAWRYYNTNRIIPTQESPPLPLKDAMALLRSVLREQIEMMGGVSMPGLVELILPVEAMDERFSDWRLWPREDWFALGRKHFVVVRPLERHNAPGFQSAWIERWNYLADKSVGEALVCVCGRDAQHKAALGAALDTDPSLTALVLGGSPRSGPASHAYRVAIASGVPMMIWQSKAPLCARSDNRACGLPGKHHCPGDAFFAAVRDALCDTSRDSVPERVRQLRNDAIAEDADHVGERIVVLWDDPHRQIPQLAYSPAPEGLTP